jgi:cell division protein FtsQ
MSSRGRSYLWPLTLIVLVLAIVAGGVFWLSQSSVLAVETVVVNGNHMLSDEEVMAIVGPRLYGKSLLKYSFDDVGEALRQLPFVENVEIKRDFPHSVNVEIWEYRPVTCYSGADGNKYFLSDDSRVLTTAEEPDTTLPVLQTGDSCTAAIGEHMECDDVATGIEFIISVPLNLNQEFSEVNVESGIIDASTISGIEVHFGTMDDYDYKFEVLRQLIARSMETGEQVVIDVSVPDRPVIRNKNQPLTEEVSEEEENGDDPVIEDELYLPTEEVDETIIEEGYQPEADEAWVE